MALVCAFLTDIFSMKWSAWLSPIASFTLFFCPPACRIKLNREENSHQLPFLLTTVICSVVSLSLSFDNAILLKCTTGIRTQFSLVESPVRVVWRIKSTVETIGPGERETDSNSKFLVYFVIVVTRTEWTNPVARCLGAIASSSECFRHSSFSS